MVYYDPYMPEIMDNPHEIYAQLRAEAPVYHIERFDAWALALFDDIWTASSDDVHYSVARSTATRAFLEGEISTSEALSNTDPPRHTDLRKTLRFRIEHLEDRAEPRDFEYLLHGLVQMAES